MASTNSPDFSSKDFILYYAFIRWLHATLDYSFIALITVYSYTVNHCLSPHQKMNIAFPGASTVSLDPTTHKINTHTICEGFLTPEP